MDIFKLTVAVAFAASVSVPSIALARSYPNRGDVGALSIDNINETLPLCGGNKQ
jgi:hypothetical protein